MGKNIDHDEEKILKLLEDETRGRMSAEYTYRTVHYNICYINTYSGNPHIVITPRYQNDPKNSIVKELGEKFNEDDAPLFYIAGCFEYWEDVLKIQKEHPNKQIEKIRLNSYEQLEYVLEFD